MTSARPRQARSPPEPILANREQDQGGRMRYAIISCMGEPSMGNGGDLAGVLAKFAADRMEQA